MLNLRTLAVLTATGLVALGLGASTNSEPLTTRIDNAIHDLEKVHAPIPHAALHARALEILRERTVAAGDDDAYATIEACTHFNAEPMHRVNCGREGAK